MKGLFEDLNKPFAIQPPTDERIDLIDQIESLKTNFVHNNCPVKLCVHSLVDLCAYALDHQCL